MKNIKFSHPKKAEMFKIKPNSNLKPNLRTFEELKVERKLAKAGFKGFY